MQMCSHSTGRQSQRFSNKSKVAPLPPSAGGGGGGGGGGEAAGADSSPGVSLMSDHLRARGGRSGVAWPAHTIPARVKKLSWDEQPHDKVCAGTQSPGPPVTRACGPGDESASVEVNQCWCL